MAIRRISVSTGGGDAPGLNAVIRAVALAAERRGWECFGIRDGYNGLIEPERSPAGYRLYGPAELQRLRTLRELARTGQSFYGRFSPRAEAA